jgi:hypothetical protein
MVNTWRSMSFVWELRCYKKKNAIKMRSTTDDLENAARLEKHRDFQVRLATRIVLCKLHYQRHFRVRERTVNKPLSGPSLRQGFSTLKDLRPHLAFIVLQTAIYWNFKATFKNVSSCCKQVRILLNNFKTFFIYSY